MSEYRCLPGPEPRTVEKRCVKCLVWKPDSTVNYRKNPHVRHGLGAACIDCLRVASKEHQRKLREADPEGYKRATAEWRKANPDRVRAISKRANAKKAATPSGALAMRMRANIGRALRLAGSSKGRRNWERLVGYTVDDLRAHIERQFMKRMSWANMGEWHVDHILPLSSFRFASAEDPEFKAAWALTNLRPLWAEDNHKKQAKRLHLL